MLQKVSLGFALYIASLLLYNIQKLCKNYPSHIIDMLVGRFIHLFMKPPMHAGYIHVYKAHTVCQAFSTLPELPQWPYTSLLIFCVCWDFAAMTNTWKKSLKRKKDVFGLPVSGFTIQSQLDPLLWAWGEMDHHSSRSMWQRLLISWQPGRREKFDVYYIDKLSLEQTPG